MTLTKKINGDREACLFSILIPSWNNLPYLQNCVSSILRHSEFPQQVIVMINEGADGTLEWVKSQPELDYVYAPENIGICYGLNACRALVQTDYMVYANDDMYFLPGWDTAFKKEAEGLPHPLFMLSATMIEPFDTGNPCVLVKDFGHSLADFKEEALLREGGKLGKKDWSGSSWPPNLIPVSTWDLIGGMSVEFSPGMYSDPDLSRKLWEAGGRYFKGLGNSRVYHFGSKSTGRIRKNKGRDTFFKKWGISPGDFYKYFLRLGQPFAGPLARPHVPTSQKLKARWKYLRHAFGKKR